MIGFIKQNVSPSTTQYTDNKARHLIFLGRLIHFGKSNDNLVSRWPSNIPDCTLLRENEIDCICNFPRQFPLFSLHPYLL